MMIPRYWKILLHGREEHDEGDVVTKDGEVLGRWSVDENDFYSFTPDGEERPIFVDPILGVFCLRVTEWYEASTGLEA